MDGKKIAADKITHLHIMYDNFYTASFINYVNEHFDKSQHKFIIIKYGHELKYVDQEINDITNVESVYVSSDWRRFIYALLRKTYFKALIDKADRIFIHYLGFWAIYYLNKYVGHQKLYWIVWGGDLYENIKIELYDQNTKRLIGLKAKPRNIVSIGLIKKSREKLIRRLDYICDHFKEEYNLLVEHFGIQANYLDFRYILDGQEDKKDKEDKRNKEDARDKSNENDGSADQDKAHDFMVYDYMANDNKAYNILLGNSAAATNNHVTILKKLASFERRDFIVYCPLSYGNPHYGNKVRSIVEELLGDRNFKGYEVFDEEFDFYGHYQKMFQ